MRQPEADLHITIACMQSTLAANVSCLYVEKKMAHWHKNTAAKHHFLDPLMRLNCTIVSAYLFKWDIPVCGCCQITSKHAVPQHTTLHLLPFYWWLMKESKNCSWNYLFAFFPLGLSVYGLQELVIYLAKLNSSPKKSYFHPQSKVIFSNPPLLSFMKHGKFHEYAKRLRAAQIQFLACGQEQNFWDLWMISLTWQLRTESFSCLQWVEYKPCSFVLCSA